MQPLQPRVVAGLVTLAFVSLTLACGNNPSNISSSSSAHSVLPGGNTGTSGQNGSTKTRGSVTPSPNVVSITPDQGTTAGGNTVTLEGTGFRDGATVSFGGSPAPTVQVVSSSSITVTTPPGSGSVAVTVTNSDGTAGTLASAFTYVSVNPNPIAATFFGMHAHSDSSWPLIAFGALRLWDTHTRWAQINTSKGTYDFSRLDSWLATVKSSGVSDVGYTFGSVPQWASSNPYDTNCDYANQPSTGGCDLPVDLSADGTGTNQTWIDFVTALAQHVYNPTYLQTHARISWWEPWNEWDRNPTVNSKWTGAISVHATYAQMVRMTEDLRCVVTGTGSVNGTPCARPAIDTGAKIVAPDWSVGPSILQNFLYCNNSPQSGSQCTTASRGSAAIDVINGHFYENGGTAENLEHQYNVVHGFLSAADQSKPMWSDEGSWHKDSSYPDPDLQASFVARYYLLGASLGLDRLYWYAYDDGGTGTLWTSFGLNKPGRAYNQIYNWLVGSTIGTPCAPVGTQWTCELTLSNGMAAQAMWDTSFSCNSGICATHEVTVSDQWSHYLDLDGNLVTIVGHQVPVGIKPILLTSSN